MSMHNGIALPKTNGIHAPKASTSKLKQRPTVVSGLYQADSVRDVADSLGIQSLQDSVANALASDVEYRINQVLEEATRFMRHAKRTTLTTSDIDLALRTLNVEPLYGHSPSIPVSFRRAQPQHNDARNFVYSVEDEEVDLERVVREKRVKVPKELGVKPHWLAVEGVQPAIPENPPPLPSQIDKPAQDVPTLSTAASTLPLPLQLYHSRLQASLLSSSDEARNAALASLASDAGLQLLVPNLVNWVGERITKELQRAEDGDPEVLEVALGMVGSMLKNEGIFLEPYLHQLLPPLLSLLLVSPHPAPPLRALTASTLRNFITRHSPKYTTLASRLLKTFLRAMLEPERQLGTRAGAVKGLASLGVEGVRRGLVESGGCKIIGRECEEAMKEGPDRDALSEVVQAVLDALQLLSPQPGSQTAEIDGLPPLPEPDPAPHYDSSPLSDPERASLEEVFGFYFSELIGANSAWGRGLLEAVGVDPKARTVEEDHGMEMEVELVS